MIRYHVHAVLSGHECGSYVNADGIDDAVKSFLRVGVSPAEVKIDIRSVEED